MLRTPAGGSACGSGSEPRTLLYDKATPEVIELPTLFQMSVIVIPFELQMPYSRMRYALLPILPWSEQVSPGPAEAASANEGGSDDIGAEFEEDGGEVSEHDMGHAGVYQVQSPFPCLCLVAAGVTRWDF